MNILHADSVGKTFGGTRVLSAATLKLPAGTVTGLLGRMGAGKSTLLRICAGWIAPDNGWVEFGGKQYFRPAADALAREGLYYLAASGNLASSLTIRDHFTALRAQFGSQAQAAALEITHLLGSRPPSLSGGERRRVELALAVSRNPRCLIMDEAFKSVDPIVASAFGTVFRALAQTGCAVVVAGHEVSTLAAHVDRIVWVTAGTTHDLGSPDAASKNDQFRREYLGPSFSKF